ncbi:MAG: type II toxin-antitoxin system HicA family toxin [Candidatus Hydrogenedentes bacterium]|nr:type II toxin-antitoxin system HicA family toxin [Candidatus Hydrogenedentota bacterium]
MNRKQRAILEAVYQVRPNIPWRDIEALLKAVGAEIEAGEGSRVRVALKGKRAVFHHPHPGPMTFRYCVRDVREFLRSVGVKPK